jgi:hypothetical protein
VPRSNGGWKRRGWIAAGVLGLFSLLALPIIALIGLGAALSGLNFNLGERKHLAPIPVPSTACPYLAPVREQANALNDLWWHEIGGSLGSRPFLPELELRLVALQQSAASAAPRLPAPIATRLRAMSLYIQAGRPELARARTATDLIADAKFELFDGLHTLADASDLVGSACGAPLYSGVAF